MARASPRGGCLPSGTPRIAARREAPPPPRPRGDPGAGTLRQVSTEYIFTMVKVSKFYGAERKVLDDITLAFLPGAKIGVLGVNGAGKSTLLRMMAGREEPSSGHADLRAGATVGFLEQEPYLDPEKAVRGNVGQVLEEKDQRGVKDYLLKELDLEQV